MKLPASRFGLKTKRLVYSQLSYYELNILLGHGFLYQGFFVESSTTKNCAFADGIIVV